MIQTDPSEFSFSTQRVISTFYTTHIIELEKLTIVAFSAAFLIIACMDYFPTEHVIENN